MITKLTLTNLKCFNALSLSCSPLTLLTGFNGGGKSTSLQTILLLSQAMRAGGRFLELPLNGVLARLGSPGEVLQEHSQSKTVQLGIETNQVKIVWHLHAENRSEGRSLKIQAIDIGTEKEELSYEHPKELNNLLPTALPGNHLAYTLTKSLSETIFLSAVRLGTAEVFPAPEDPQPVHADVGLQGEFAPWWFLQADLDNIEKERCHPSTASTIPRIQFNAWANELFPGSEANVQAIPQTGLTRLELRIGNTEWRRPANIGYGLTYAFPVLVAGLLAKKGQILIIDSPEAHLHPKGQSSIGRFLAHMAAAGVQIMIETHSDHVLNGILIASKEYEENGVGINRNQVKIHYFDQDPSTNSARPTEIKIQHGGKIDMQPDGFFDQIDKDSEVLMGF